ncbi:lysophospholipase catalytic domain-containing protein [Penicillium cataractarum]|uniref:Lysophospholipase n=1 Tax=Penicillium cataractarum TaxID=2100454 RepID=A0A9W9SQP3_9EURO|nr:lysophospholipase catalytic domain-containing protein [Penicillium cataractarum]KAJ5382064.1 lysophospholipase catalytic domain-containing protein [Penicillium cataractarum]
MLNISTLALEINDTERDKLVLNGYNVATMGNSTEWGICIGCAIIMRVWIVSTNIVGNGTVDATTPKTYEPRQKIK